MRVLAEIKWCETHKQSTDSDETCYGFFDRRVNPCVVVDVQVTRKIPTADEVFGILADDREEG